MAAKKIYPGFILLAMIWRIMCREYQPPVRIRSASISVTSYIFLSERKGQIFCPKWPIWGILIKTRPLVRDCRKKTRPINTKFLTKIHWRIWVEKGRPHEHHRLAIGIILCGLCWTILCAVILSIWNSAIEICSFVRVSLIGRSSGAGEILDGCALLGHEHDDVINWQHFPRYWPFVRGIHRSPANSPHTQRRSFDVFFDLRPNNGWVNNSKAGDLKRHHAHYDAIIMRRNIFTWLYTL